MIRQFATFRLEDDLFGIDVLLIDEINRNLDIVPVAGAPDFVRGLLNLRGQIVTIIDLSTRFGFGDQVITSESRGIILKTTGMLNSFREAGVLHDDTSTDLVALLVSRVEDMISLDDARIDSAPGIFSDEAGAYISGVVQMDNDLLNILRAAGIVAHMEPDNPRADAI